MKVCKICKPLKYTGRFFKINKLRFTSSITSSSSFTNIFNINKLAINVVKTLKSFNHVNNFEHKKKS